MSQRGSASLPVSRPSSQSPRTQPASTGATLPIPSATSDDVAHNHARSPPRMTLGRDEASRGSRPHDFHSVLLNPPDHVDASKTPPDSLNSGSEPQPAPPGHVRVVSGPPAIPPHPHYQQQQPSPHAYFQRLSHGGNLPPVSLQADRGHPGVLGLDRGSPKTASSPWAPNPRTDPELQSPRTRNAQNPAARAAESYAPASIAGTKRPFDNDAGYGTSTPPARLPPGSYLGPPAPPTALHPRAEGLRTNFRSFSHPVHPHDPQPGAPVPWQQQQQHPDQPQAGWEQGAAYGATTRPASRETQGPVLAARGAFSAPGTPTPADFPPGLPGHELIPVTIDHTSGSIKKSETRRKNAEASHKFRVRKKGMQTQLEREYQELRRQAEEIQEERDGLRDVILRIPGMGETQRDREWLRGVVLRVPGTGGTPQERDRMRDAVLRIPGMGEASWGQPSPQRTAAHGAMFPGNLAPTQPAPLPSAPMAQPGYALSETADAERPARRRRTDHSRDVSGALYNPPQPQPQQPPAMAFPYAAPSPRPELAPTMSPSRPELAYASPSRPELATYTMPSSRPASASSAEMLPPLRSIGAGAMEGAPQGQGQHVRAPYEAGFLHAPREVPREPPRGPEGQVQR